MTWRLARASLALAVCAVLPLSLACGTRASAQQCPRANPVGPTIPSEVRTLNGRLIYHDGIRQWFELKLDKPECGQRSIQLVQLGDGSNDLEVLRGCPIKSTGKFDFAGTGYYSRDVYQTVTKVAPVATCARQPPLQDYSNAIPSADVRSYTVDMLVDYRPGDHPITFHVQSGGTELRPWQAYASYWLTGGYVLYGHCGRGFVVDRVFGTPSAHPMHFDEPRTPDDMADFDPESAAASGSTELHLGYSCIRDPARGR